MEKYIDLSDLDIIELQNLCGIEDSNIKVLEEHYHKTFIMRDNKFKIMDIDDDMYKELVKVINHMLDKLHHNKQLSNDDVRICINEVNNIENKNINKNKIIAYNKANIAIKAKTYGQALLIDSIYNNDITISCGPAGTGKTYLSVVLAVDALKKGEVKRIVLTRPAVEAGESLGFLPGDLKEKVDPYLMPLYDALYEMLGEEKVLNYEEKGIIEIIPLAYMRGRTLNDAFIILDEAQNTTITQMMMFLTRLGNHSKMVINGDLSQIDLNIKKTSSGLEDAIKRLNDIKGINIISLKGDDIIRNPLVAKIVERYSK